MAETPADAARSDQQHYHVMHRLEQEQRFDPIPTQREPLNLQWYELEWDEKGNPVKRPLPT